MGPLIPLVIPESLDLVLALFIGLGFGFVLEQAGFSSSRRLAGVFYGYDFTVLRVFFTAAVTAMTGVILLEAFGFLDLTAVFINPLWVKPAILGGVIMGVGFILGGYCPGTSVCAAAIGKIDALWFIGGSLLGIFAFGEAFGRFQAFFTSTARGPVKVFESLGISMGAFAFLLILMAVGAFWATTRIERKVAGEQAPSATFRSMPHVLAGVGVVLLGAVLAFLPDHRTRLQRRVADPAFQAAHPVPVMDADELAFRLVDRDPTLQLLDLRPAADFKPTAFPGALNLGAGDLFTREPGVALTDRRLLKVVVAEDEARARQGALLLQELGYEQVACLKGGWPSFAHLYLQDTPFVPTGGREDATVQAFRESARVQLAALIQARRASEKPAAPKAARAIKGGC